jgi:hypothetical protein
VASKQYGRAQDMAVDALDDAHTAIKGNPFTAVVIALGIGFLFGVVAGVATERREAYRGPRMQGLLVMGAVLDRESTVMKTRKWLEAGNISGEKAKPKKIPTRVAESSVESSASAVEWAATTGGALQPDSRWGL